MRQQISGIHFRLRFIQACTGEPNYRRLPLRPSPNRTLPKRKLANRVLRGPSRITCLLSERISTRCTPSPRLRRHPDQQSFLAVLPVHLPNHAGVVKKQVSPTDQPAACRREAHLSTVVTFGHQRIIHSESWLDGRSVCVRNVPRRSA